MGSDRGYGAVVPLRFEGCVDGARATDQAVGYVPPCIQKFHAAQIILCGCCQDRQFGIPASRRCQPYARTIDIEGGRPDVLLELSESKVRHLYGHVPLGGLRPDSEKSQQIFPEA